MIGDRLLLFAFAANDLDPMRSDIVGDDLNGLMYPGGASIIPSVRGKGRLAESRLLVGVAPENRYPVSKIRVKIM